VPNDSENPLTGMPYHEQFADILGNNPSKTQWIANCRTLAAEADHWKRESETMSRLVIELQKMVRGMLANSQDRCERLDAKLGLPNLADDDEPDLNALPPRGAMH
jgi:hypothetical protein